MRRLKEFIAFRTVVEQKSFSRAAEVIGISQPAVSLQIKSLEEDYGAELLHRDGFEIVPTESGRFVYETACQIVSLYETSHQQIAELTGEAQGRLVIGASTGPGEYLLPVLLGRFWEEHPKVEVALRVSDSSSIIESVLQHRLALGVVGTSRRDRHLTFEPFIRDRLVLVIHPEHPWTERGHISYEELLSAPLILQQQGSGANEALNQALGEYDIDLNQLNVIMELGLQESSKAAVRAGLGVTIISRLGVIQELQRAALCEVAIEGLELQRNFYIVYRRTTPLTVLARAFLQFAKPAAEQLITDLAL
jgi:DNA-binding transcriptional LysR family regulator